MAPELLNNSSYSEKIDMYSFAMCMFLYMCSCLTRSRFIWADNAKNSFRWPRIRRIMRSCSYERRTTSYTHQLSSSILCIIFYFCLFRRLLDNFKFNAAMLVCKSGSPSLFRNDIGTIGGTIFGEITDHNTNWFTVILRTTFPSLSMLAVEGATIKTEKINILEQKDPMECSYGTGVSFRLNINALIVKPPLFRPRVKHSGYRINPPKDRGKRSI